jgi:CheY-like chemotaxis protein
MASASGSLPDIDGEEVTRRIKADPATKRIPVIALTANAMSSDRDKAIAAGAMTSIPNQWICRVCSEKSQC